MACSMEIAAHSWTTLSSSFAMARARMESISGRSGTLGVWHGVKAVTCVDSHRKLLIQLLKNNTQNIHAQNLSVPRVRVAVRVASSNHVFSYGRLLLSVQSSHGVMRRTTY